MRFHRRCGDRVTLLNENSTAVRNFVEFNHGLILSSEPLKDDVIFEVSIDRKVNVWNGSLEIGVTTLDPEFVELPATATKLKNSAWIMSGSSIVKDGITLVNCYGPELDTLREGDCIGVMRSNKGELKFYLNGQCLGVAARELPSRLFAVIDLYGQCVQVSILRTNDMRPIMENSIDQTEEDPNNDDTMASTELDVACLPTEPSQCPKETCSVLIPMPSEGPSTIIVQDRLRFHPRCGILVKLTNNNKTAERARPLDDYNNGVVMTHRPLYDNELFEIRIDRLVDKWSGSIEVGVTTHNPMTIRFPSTMTNMDSGTIMMSGCKVLLNGHGTCMEYGNFNLDELREGDTVGMMRKNNGKLHYFINGVDQGVATDKVEQQVWGVVDLYGMTVKVSIVDPCEEMDSNINPPLPLNSPEIPAPSRFVPRIDEDSLLFHTLRDSTVIITNDGKTAHRPNAFKYFHNGFVMTNRTLRTNELFQVRLDLIIPKWAGSIEIGVTQHSSNDLEFPFKIRNAKSGTWAVTGEDVIRDGSIVIPQYVRNLSRLVEGDTVGVMRKEQGVLHFFVNGIDQGPAAFNVPEHVFGIIDLYGRAAQATIVDAYTPPPIYSPESPMSTESNATIFPEMCFHRVHGRNARLTGNRLSAWRATVYSEFNDAVLFSSRPLRECDMFEIRIDKMVDCWIGSIEIGVTAIRPDDLEGGGGVGALAGTATDLNRGTYILSGAAMMKDGECVRSAYPLDLDTLTVGSRVGMMWHADRSLHYYLDGMDMGKAWYVPHLNIYAVVDLYGQCTQNNFAMLGAPSSYYKSMTRDCISTYVKVSILQNEERAFNYNVCSNSDNSILTSNSRAMSSPPPPYWSFSEYCGNNIILMYDYSLARRRTEDPMATLIFSSAHLAPGELFEIKIADLEDEEAYYAGTFRIGVTDINILNAHVNRCLPPSVAFLPHYTAFIDGRYLKYTRPGTTEHDVCSFVPSFEWLRYGDRIGLKKVNDSRVLIYYNSEELDTAFEKVPDKVYVVMEIFGNVTQIRAVYQDIGIPLNQSIILNDEYPKQLTVPAHLLNGDTDSTDEVFDGTLPNIKSTEREQLVSGEPRTSERTVDDNPGEVSPLEEAPELCEAPGLCDDTQATEEDVLQLGDEATDLTTKKLADKTICDKTTAQSTQAAADEPKTVQPHGKGKGKGKRGSTASTSSIVPVASTSAANPSCGGLGGADGPITPSEQSIETTDEPMPRMRRNHLPYTFYNVHGKNIKLCSSDTVAVRVKGYRDAVAVISQPLRRGHNFRFRVDKTCDEWLGTVTIGAVGMLPLETPSNAVHLEPPCWVLSSDLLNDNGTFYYSMMGMALDDLTEQSVLTLHFRFSSELILQVNGKLVGCIATVPRRFSHIFPTIDLYGRICQISVLLHPYVVARGASLDLPIITENLEEALEDDLPDEDATDVLEDPESRTIKKPKAYSQDNLIDNDWEPAFVPDGPSYGLSYTPYRVPTPLPYRTPTPIPMPVMPPAGGPVPNPLTPAKKKLKNKSKSKDADKKPELPAEIPMHQSLNLPDHTPLIDNNEMVNRCIRRSHSTHNFNHVAEVNEAASTIRHTFSVESRVGSRTTDIQIDEQFCDTNIRHNDRYPEALSDFVDIDNEIMDALTLETGNLPDLTEEQSSSIDDSTRRDDSWCETLSVEYLHYLNRILCMDQEGIDTGHSLESEWEASGESCEHLHLVLKYWNYLVLPYPELRQAVSWGQVRCYCTNCQPDGSLNIAGWVRIERIDGVGASRRAFWHVVRSTLGAAQMARGERGPIRRPRSLSVAPCPAPPFADVWFDEEGKPHHTVLAIEIDVEGSNAENDRLLAFLIYLRPHSSFTEDNPPSLEE